jgi:5-methylcytosine-specific restriction endonuclease McrA
MAENKDSTKSCRDKANARAARYRAAHPEKWRAASAKWLAANPDRVRARAAKYRAAHPERERAHSAKWQRENPEKAQASNAKYRAANPDKVRAGIARYAAANPDKMRAKDAKRRARKFNAPGRGVTAAQWRQVVADSLGLCAYCNERRPLTMDHIEPLALGGEHDIDNITAACGPCNYSKCDTPLVVWLARRDKPPFVFVGQSELSLA